MGKFISDADMASIEAKKPKFISDEEMSKMDTKNSGPSVAGELGFMDRAALGFASGQDEKEAYLSKKYPGAKFSDYEFLEKAGSDPTKERVVQIPGEKNFRRFDAPGFSAPDIADFAGDVPSLAGGLLGGTGGFFGGGPFGAAAAGALGAGGGEAARKAIGRGLIGIPRKQSLLEDTGDVAINSVIGGTVNAAAPILMGAARGAPGVMKEGVKKVGGLLGEGMRDAGLLARQESKPIVVETLKRPGLSELNSMVQRGESKGLESGARVAKETADALSIAPELNESIHPVFLDMLESPTKFAEIDTKIMNAYDPEGRPVADMLNKIKEQGRQRSIQMMGDTIDSLGTGRYKTDAVNDSGEAFKSEVKGIYNQVKDDLGPMFQKFEKVRIPKQENTLNLKSRMVEASPELSNYLAPGQNGEIMFSGPWNSKMPISKEEYSAIKEAFDSINSGDSSFKEMQNIMRNLGSHIDNANPQKTANLGRIKSSILSHMEDMVSAKNPSLNVRDTFKQYAQNEQKRELISEMLGVDMKSQKAFSSIPSEKILDRIFANSDNAKLAEQVIGPDSMRDYAGDYLKYQMSKMSPGGKFSATQFRAFLDNPAKKEMLMQTMGPDAYNKLRAISIVQQRVFDMKPFNTSGTSTASNIRAGGLLEKGLGYVQNPTKMLTDSVQAVTGAIDDRAAKKAAGSAAEEALTGLPSGRKKAAGLIGREKLKTGGIAVGNSQAQRGKK